MNVPASALETNIHILKIGYSVPRRQTRLSEIATQGPLFFLFSAERDPTNLANRQTLERGSADPRFAEMIVSPKLVTFGFQV